MRRAIALPLTTAALLLVAAAPASAARSQLFHVTVFTPAGTQTVSCGSYQGPSPHVEDAYTYCRLDYAVGSSTGTQCLRVSDQQLIRYVVFGLNPEYIPNSVGRCFYD